MTQQVSEHVFLCFPGGKKVDLGPTGRMTSPRLRFSTKAEYAKDYHEQVCALHNELQSIAQGGDAGGRLSAIRFRIFQDRMFEQGWADILLPLIETKYRLENLEVEEF